MPRRLTIPSTTRVLTSWGLVCLLGGLSGCAADRLPVSEDAGGVTEDVVEVDTSPGPMDVCGAEVCNGEDDDCDGEVDEQQDAPLCSPPVVTMVSACEGACVDRCAPGYVDSDGLAATGCECLEGRPGCALCDEVPGCEAGDPLMYDLTPPASYINTFTLALTADDAPDLTGDGVGDNAAGIALGSLFDLVDRENVNTFIARAIGSGEMAVGLVWPGWGTLETALHVVLLDGEPEGGEALLGEDSFISGSSTPRHRFAVSKVDRGVVTASAGRLPVAFTVEELTLNMTLEQVSISGLALADGPNGVRLSRTELSGALMNVDLAQNLEAFVQSSSCRCLGVSEPVFLMTGDNTLTCGGAPDLDACEQGDEVERLCGTVASLCEVVGLVFETQADLDLNGDGTPDAMSLYADVGAVGIDLGW